jgi:hypothetical protein
MKETTSEDAVIVHHDRHRGSVFTGCHVARTRRRLDQPLSAGHLRRRRRPPPPCLGQMPQIPSCSEKDLGGPSPEPKMWRRQSRMRPIQAHRAQIGSACPPPAHTTGRRRQADSPPPPSRCTTGRCDRGGRRRRRPNSGRGRPPPLPYPRALPGDASGGGGGGEAHEGEVKEGGRGGAQARRGGAAPRGAERERVEGVGAEHASLSKCTARI